MRVHCCLIDRECRGVASRFAGPLRLHVGNRMITVWSNNRRSRKQWNRAWAEGRAFRRGEDGKLRNIRGEESRDW